MKKVTLRGRGLTCGKVEGEAIVTNKPFGFWLGINPNTGLVVDRRSPIYGQKIAGKIFVFPFGRGSTGGNAILLETARCGNAPLAMVNIETELILLSGALLAQELYNLVIPVVDKLDKDPIKLIKTGDRVIVNADNGTVDIYK